jgi:hypothetical protein
MTEIKDLVTLDPVDTSYFVPVQAATGETAKLALSAIGGTSWVPVPNNGIQVVVTGSAKYMVYGTGEFLLPTNPTDGTEIIINNIVVATTDITFLSPGQNIENTLANSAAIPIGGARGIYSLIYGFNSWYFGFGTMTIDAAPPNL